MNNKKALVFEYILIFFFIILLAVFATILSYKLSDRSNLSNPCKSLGYKEVRYSWECNGTVKYISKKICCKNS